MLGAAAHHRHVPWWSTLDVSTWKALLHEPRGLREKYWVSDDTGKAWLRKSCRSSRPFEPAIEAFTLELARRFGLEVAHGRACTWVDSGGRNVSGFASRRFHTEDEEHATGGELVAPFLDVPFSTSSERMAARAHVTLPVVRETLETVGARHKTDLVTPFVRMLVFDAWIGNGDRHSGNWAVVFGASGCSLAPMYDTAACLGAELQDVTLAKWLGRADRAASMAKYADGCRSGFGDDLVPGVFQRDLIGAVKAWPEWKHEAPALVSSFFDRFEVVNELLGEIPEQWFPQRRQEFARELLVARVKMLQGAVG